MKQEYIRTLIGKFFDGETSLEEESRLYDYFRQESLPASLQPYRELFAGLQAVSLPPAALHQGRRKPLLLRWAVGTAASLVVLITAAGLWQQHSQQLLARQYEGSYMIVNGRRIDNLSEMKPTIEQTLAEADRIKREIQQASAQ